MSPLSSVYYLEIPIVIIIGLLYHIAAIQTKRSNTYNCIDNFFIWRDIFTKFNMYYYRRQREKSTKKNFRADYGNYMLYCSGSLESKVCVRNFRSIPQELRDLFATDLAKTTELVTLIVVCRYVIGPSTFPFNKFNISCSGYKNDHDVLNLFQGQDIR